jgi:RNA polymerase-binding transcription factor DksA
MKAERARSLLEQERRRLQEAMDGVQKGTESQSWSTSELSTIDQHPADQGSETFEREKDFAILESLEESLADVERALGRVEDGSYGTCEVCGRKIPDERLEARPMTRFCVEHQQATERAVR